MIFPSKSPTSRIWFRILTLLLSFFLLRQLFYIHQTFSLLQDDSDYDLQQDSCDTATYRALDDVLVALRTGANEAPEKLPAHFTTTLRCVPDYVIYSDLEEDIAGHHVHDALDDVDPRVKRAHPDFEYYRQLQEKGRNAFSPADLARWAATKNTDRGRDSPGWKLDKWKFLPVAEKALRLRPDARWYVFLEADTAVLWEGMVDWLAHFDAKRPWYLGVQMQIGDVVFAYGGSGFVVSGPALRGLVARRRANLRFYDDFTAGHWAGDCVLGKAMADTGVQLSWALPNLIGDEPAVVDFNVTTPGIPKREPWCFHAASYHHVSPLDLKRFFNFQRRWYRDNDVILRHGDVFKHYVLPQIKEKLVDWDNLSSDHHGNVTSFDECRAVCERQSGCVQFMLYGKSCRTSKSPKLGRRQKRAAVGAGEAEPAVSGWIMDRVYAFVGEMDSTCGRQGWLVP